MTIFSKRIIFEITIAIFISALVVIFSESYIFNKIFSFYNIQHLTPSFADFRSYQALPATVDSGHNPYLNHEFDPWKRPFNLPYIWFYISKYLNLANELNFKLFVSSYISFFIFCIFRTASLTKNNLSYIIVIFISLSASSILALERGNTDILIFSIIFAACIIKKFYLNLSLLVFAAMLKLYPIFSFIINFDNRKKFYFSFFGFLIAFITIFSNLKYYFYNTHSTFNTGITFGIRPIILGFFKAFERLDVDFFEYNNFNFILIFGTILILTLIFFFYFAYKNINYKDGNINFVDIKNRLFLAGSSIYCFSFIFFSSFDYRLIFLILTIPYLIENIDRVKIFSIIFIFLSSNSLIFYSFANSSSDFVYIGLLVHMCKSILFLLVFYELTKFYKVFFNRIVLSKD
tara:strand:+ start:2508 stop:3719 length:1212 start_codon:yes stop_codon:yes gene_type:complete